MPSGPKLRDTTRNSRKLSRSAPIRHASSTSALRPVCCPGESLGESFAIDPLLPTRLPAVVRYLRRRVERLGWHVTRHPSAGSHDVRAAQFRSDARRHLRFRLLAYQELGMSPRDARY